MKYYEIQNCIFKVFAECKVNFFPVDCKIFLKHYGYSVYTYEELRQKNESLYEMCIAFSDEAFREGQSKIIAYNDQRSATRIRFSLAHELGHHMLKHTGESLQNERESNYFASHLLAPRIVIHYSGCKDADDIALAFHLSREAARIAWEDYSRWYQNFCMHNGYINQQDYNIYNHFCTGTDKKFIWNKKKCDFCGKTLYNSLVNHCECCNFDKWNSSSHYLNLSEEDTDILHRMENKYLTPP